ncbi:MAG TPA: hypothetical protein VNE39_23750 [Planctomycetota bacterium]|nr:hypothetical protein [Planctomycetota bacterium]
MFSIDQNCHSLWDTLPKLHALAAHGHRVTHFIEDIDVAFTAMGASVDDAVLHLARERFHRSGGQDWGAALFYSDFLGRLAVEIRHWEPLTGLQTKTLAKQLGRSVDDLYDAFSPGDTWQLIGSSYIGDRDHHRVIGDLAVREVRDFLLDLVQRAKGDMLRAFPQRDSQQRLNDWFREEEARVARLLEHHAADGLVDLYRGWLGEHLSTDNVSLALTSSLFACGDDATRTALLDGFVADYERGARLYNEALAEAGSDLRPLDTSRGELPFFAIQDHQGHLVRTAAYLRGSEVQLGRQSFPVRDGRLPAGAMAEAGIRCLAGKAILLVTQARIGPKGAPLALPYRGSLYMPAAHRLAAKLAANGLLPGALQPIVRVRFRFLDQLRRLDTTIHLPDHLADCFGHSEIPAQELGRSWATLAEEAAKSLAMLGEDASRKRWQADRFPELTGRIAELEARRKEMSQASCTPEQMSGIWKETKGLQAQLLDQMVRRVARDWQVRELDYWDSRGALLPWSIALGGREFYDHLVANAEISEEPHSLPA